MLNGGSRGVPIFQEIPAQISEDKVLHSDLKHVFHSRLFTAHLKPIL